LNVKGCKLLDVTIDWTEIYKTYKGKWVALADDEKTVIAYGTNASKVWNEARKKMSKPILMQVPSELIAYVG